MLGVLLSFILVQCCLCSDWRQDSYLDAYTESEGTVFEGPYPHYPRMPMKNATTVSMMPFLLQLILILAKIMLKFTIFKIIVKFIAVVCLFLFIPTLRLPKARDAGRSDKNIWEAMPHGINNNSIESLAVLVKEAITKYKDMLT
nr:uncharacterized protein LOC106685327 [Halyomorpha halys]